MTTKTTIATKTNKESLLEMVEFLPERLCAAVQDAVLDYLEKHDRMIWLQLTAPEDDEPLTEEDRIAIEEAEAEIRAGKGIPHEEVVRELRDLL